MRMLTEAEAAEILGVDKRAIQAERYAGRLPYARIAGKIRIPEAELDAYIQRITVTRPCQDQGSRPASLPLRTRRSSRSPLLTKSQAELSLDQRVQRIRARLRNPG
ncbi:helix-turn-helix domain-containing protein [Aliidongia dinghuensis]|uniref:helix-turn-helix domain-containing protein n=1 Tax=Aliidongia dinghuensis TaxID=1867774 RepID=UPI00166BDF7B|nr:helix-turn-helix domain-containing protein [Aliidongia dinghuensis]